MDNDLNTPMAIAELQKLRNDVNKLFDAGLSTQSRQQARECFRSLGAVLGLFQLDRWDYRIKPPSGHLGIELKGVEATVSTGQLSVSTLSDGQIEQLIAERLDARKQKNFKKADEIRKTLESHGIIVEDKPDGTSRWKR
jgi:cysteinyl-tRNA synthetase